MGREDDEKQHAKGVYQEACCIDFISMRNISLYSVCSNYRNGVVHVASFCAAWTFMMEKTWIFQITYLVMLEM